MTEPNYVLRVDGMMCQKNCATTVCKAIKAVHSVTNAEVTFAAEEAKVWAPLNSIAAVISAVEDVGYDAVLKSKQSADKAPNDDVGYMDIDSIGGREERADTGHTEVGIDLDVDLDNEDSQPPDLVLQIGGLRDREACALKIVTALLTVDGVLSVNIDFDRKTASIWGFADYASITKSVEGAGYTVNDGHSDEAATNSSSKLHQNAKKSPHTTAGKEVIELLCESEDTKQIQAKLGVVNGVDKITFDANNGVVSIVIDSSLLSADHVADILRGHGISSAVKKVSTVEPDTAAADYSVELSITGMSCANCAAKIERSLGKLPGVSSATISSMTNRGLVVLSSHSSHATGTRDIVDAVQAMGYGCELLSNDAGKGHSLQDSAEIEMNEWWRLLMIAVVFGIPVLILHTIESMTMGSVTFLDNAAVCGDGITTGQLLMFLLNSPIMVIVGFRFYKAAFLGAMHGSYGMDLLVVTGTSVTFAYSCVQLLIACRSDMPASHVYFEAAGMLLMFVTVGKYVEAYAKGRTVASISSLLQLQPREV